MLCSDLFKKKRGKPRKIGPDDKPAVTLSPMPISSSIPLTGDYISWKQKPLGSIKRKEKLEFCPPGCLGSQRQLVQHVALFIFGDSLFDPGNNNYINTTTDFLVNFSPYGESYFNPPSGRFSDERLIPDFIAEYARLPLILAYLDPRNKEFVHGANFASGGAGALGETHVGFVLDLKTQPQYLSDLEKHFSINLGNSKTKELLSEAVYLFSVSGNDYLAPVGNNESVLYPYTHEQYVDMVIGNLTDVFKIVKLLLKILKRWSIKS